MDRVLGCAHRSTKAQVRGKKEEQIRTACEVLHVADGSHVSMSYYDMVHKPIPIPKAMKILDAKAALDKEWEDLQELPAGDKSKITSKKEMIRRAQLGSQKVHYAASMDLCHLQNSEFENQMYNGRVVLRGDIVKDDSRNYDLFADLDQMTESKWTIKSGLS